MTPGGGAKIRNPKHEIRNKVKKQERRKIQKNAYGGHLVLRFPPLSFDIVSDFVLRISDFSPSMALRHEPAPAQIPQNSWSSTFSIGVCTQVKIGVSRNVYLLLCVSRNSITRSRKSLGSSVSNDTTNSWSSRPKLLAVLSFTLGYLLPTRICPSMIFWRSSSGIRYQ